MNYEDKLLELGYDINLSKPSNLRPFESAVLTGNLVFVSGHASRVNGELIHSGIVGDNITTEEAQDAAIACFINCLKAIKDLTGTLDSITKIVNIRGYVASAPEYKEQPKVMDVVSNMINKVFGEVGKHSRSAIGVASLPGGTSVEIEMVVEIK